MNNIYEISVWEDVHSDGVFNERKICVIGSNTMESQARAREPKLVTKTDGTATFTFNLYYKYIDSFTGKKVENPYVKYLINERKVKVFWKEKWYDLLVKDIREDPIQQVFSYTCEDAYITELGKTGFDLEFSTDLQNNIGTAEYLVEQTLEDTDWRYRASDTIYQVTEEPVYEVLTTAAFSAKKVPELQNEITIAASSSILVYYSMVSDEDNMPKKFCFHYCADGPWEKDGAEMKVINGDCYQISGDVSYIIGEHSIIVKQNGTNLFTISLDDGLSTNYRAERYVETQEQAYSKLLNRYVNVYEGQNNTRYYGYESTVYETPLTVVNLVTNSSNFKDVSGWEGEGLKFELYPPFMNSSTLSEYSSKSYLNVTIPQGASSAQLYNSGIQNNKVYIPEGFSVGEYYIFRIKAENSSHNPVEVTSVLTPSINYWTTQNDKKTKGNALFNIAAASYTDGWLEYRMRCVESRAVDDLDSATTPFGIFITANQNCYIEEIQFFKEAYGIDNDSTARLEPGEMDIQAAAQVVWKYYQASKESSITSLENLEYDYVGNEEWDALTPIYNSFEKVGTIEIEKSNRFNILQTIAESFQCWVRFEIEHESDGSISYDEEGPRKFVTLKGEVGQDTGVTFRYGIDLQSLTRSVKSTNIATKTIVSSNENEFGKNGFCSIARSKSNYSGENFIYDFGYFINQNLIDAEVLNKDLYSNEEGYLGYYKTLHEQNKVYSHNAEKLTKKTAEQIRQAAALEVYHQYLTSAQAQLTKVENDIMQLANVNSVSAAQSYLQNHSDFTKVQTLMNNRTQIQSDINKYSNLYNKTLAGLTQLESEIATLETSQSSIISTISAAHLAFQKKYARFIQEGTWSSEDYWDDTKYYLDAVSVAYTSARPQVEYDINVVRLSDLEEYKSKTFDLNDICYIQDTEYFGYLPDGITPYKESIFVSEVTSYFDSPDKDTIKVQNYKDNFDDLFQRIAAATQSLEFSQGKYAKAANVINSDGTIKSSVIQSTFDQNSNLVLGAVTETTQIDNKGITVIDDQDASKQVRITSGGIFVSSDGGNTWHNAVRGDGITADVITAGQIDTSKITIYDENAPSFVWDANGISAYLLDQYGVANENQYVRFDKYGLYGINGSNVVIDSEQDVWNNASFGFTWNKFFLKNQTNYGGVEISSDSDILVTAGSGNSAVERVKIGNLGNNTYGIRIKDNNNNSVFVANEDGVSISGSVTIGSHTAQDISDKVDSTIVSEITYYLATSAATGVTTNTPGWTTNTSEAVLTPTNKYLWIYKVQTYGNGVTESTTPIITGVYGNEGQDGQPGQDGENALTLYISSSNGNIFKNGDISTVLSARVFSGSNDVTNDYDSNAFIWTRVSSDTAADDVWNNNHYGGTKQITITSSDVYVRATFFCDLINTTTRQSLL